MLHSSNHLLEKLIRPVLILVITSWFLLGSWLAVPWTGIAGLGVLAASLLATAIVPVIQNGNRQGMMVASSWIASLTIPAGIWIEKHGSFVPDFSYTMVAWLIAGAVLLTSLKVPDTANRKGWQGLAITWAFAGAAIWLMSSYLQNDRIAFHLAVLAALALSILWSRVLSRRYIVVVTANTLILILVFVPVADFFVRPSYDLNPQIDDAGRLYSYEAARRDPTAFAAWWKQYREQFHKMVAELGSNSKGPHTTTLPPSSHAMFFRSRVQINSKGFRGPEITDEEDGAYRIVALGESTTFGMTIRTNDRPWPEALEQIIHDRLKPDRPVQVINAGVCAVTLADNLQRFPTEILPLKPDMIISYHGFNGFVFLDPAMPRTHGHRQPAYRSRPLKLLADAEYGIKMAVYRRSFIPKTTPSRFGSIAVKDTDYARVYQTLIQAAKTNHVRLVLANFSMAVNDQSPPDVVTFYRAGFPAVNWQIQANILHSKLIRELASEHADILSLDTNPKLDGEHEKFIDLIHFTQEGRDQLAENIFAGIENILQNDLGAITNVIAPPSPVR